jgi:hypothetical protein
VNGNGDSIGIFGSNNAVVASNATVYDGSSAGTGVAGSGDTINLNSNSGASVTVTGTGDTVNAAGDAVYVGANTTATLSGPENAVEVTQSGDNLTVDGSDTIYLSSGVSGTFGGTWSDGTFSAAYSGGELNTAAVDYNDGYKDDFSYYYYSNGTMEDYLSFLYNPSGTEVWWGGYNPSNQLIADSQPTFTDPDGTYGGGEGDYGDDDFGDLDLASSPTPADPPGTNVYQA